MDRREIESLVNDIELEASTRLTDWETKFIASLRQRLENGSPFTEYQEQKLQEIYDEYIN